MIVSRMQCAPWNPNHYFSPFPPSLPFHSIARIGGRQLLSSTSIDGVCTQRNKRYTLQIVADTCVWWDCTGLVTEDYETTQARLSRLFLTGLLPALSCPSGTFESPLVCPPGYVMGGPFLDVMYTASTGYRGALCCRIQLVSTP